MKTLLVTASISDQILEYDLNGNFLGVFIDGSDPNDNLDRPYNIKYHEIAGVGYYFVSSLDTNQVLKYDLQGNFVDVFVNGNDENIPLAGPVGLVFDDQDNLLVSSFGFFDENFNPVNAQVLKFDKEGNYLGIFTGDEPEGTLSGVSGLALGDDGTVYVNSVWSNRIVTYDLQGNFQEVLIQGNTPTEPLNPEAFPLQGPFELNIGDDGNLYVSSLGVADQIGTGDDLFSAILTYDTEGNYLGVFGDAFGDPSNPEGQFERPHGNTFDDEGNFYVASALKNKILYFDSEGNALGVFGEAEGDSSGISGVLSGPTDLTFTPDTEMGTLKNAYIIGQENFDSWSQGFDASGYLKVLPHPDEKIEYKDPFLLWQQDNIDYKNGVFSYQGANGEYYSSWGPIETLEVTLNMDELEQLVIDGFGILEPGDGFIDWLGKATPYDILRAYNGQINGPMLITEPGDTLKITLNNNLDQITNLHTHGLHVSAVGNGDNVLIAVAPGDSWEIEIKIPEDHFIGPDWYHPHLHGETNEQVASGLGGYLLINPPYDLPDLDKYDPVTEPAFFMAIQSFGIQQEYRSSSPTDPLNQSPLGVVVPAGTPLDQSMIVDFEGEYAMASIFSLIPGTNVYEINLNGSDPDSILPIFTGKIYGTIDQNGRGHFNSNPTVFGLTGFESGFVALEDSEGNGIFGTDDANSEINFFTGQVNASGLVTLTGGNGIFAGAEGEINLSELGVFNPDPNLPYHADIITSVNFTVPNPIFGVPNTEVVYNLSESPFVGYNAKPLNYNPQAPQGNPIPGPNFSSAYGEGALAEPVENVIHTVNSQYNPTIETTTGQWNLFSFANMTVNSFQIIQLIKEEADGTLTPQEMLLTAIDGDAAGVVEGVRREVMESPVLNPGSRLSLQNWFEEPGKYYFLANATEEILGDDAPLLTKDKGFKDGHLTWGSQVLATVEVTGESAPTGDFPEIYDILIEQSEEINALVDDVLANGPTQERNFTWSANIGGAILEGNFPDDTEVSSFEGTYRINGEYFATEGGGMPPLTMPMLGTTEIWNLSNISGISDELYAQLGIDLPLLEWHPFHIHQNDFIVLSINGIAVEDMNQNYLARVLSDTIALSPSYAPGSVTPENPYGTPQINGEPSVVQILMEFADYPGSYVNHCHILFHEDAGMMAVVRVILNTDDTWLGLGSDNGRSVNLFKASNTEDQIRIDAYNSANGVDVAIADVNFKNYLGEGNTNVTDNVTDIVTIQKQLTNSNQEFTIKVFDGQRLFEAQKGKLNIQAEYIVNNTADFFEPNFERININGESQNATYQLNTIDASTYITYPNYPSQDVFIGNTDPTQLGRTIPPYEQLVWEFFDSENNANKLFGTQSSGGIRDAVANEVNGEGVINIFGGEGKFAGATGTLPYTEKLSLVTFEASLAVHGELNIAPRSNISDDALDLLLTEITPFQNIEFTTQQEASVATGDIDGDGFADILTALGGGIAPIVELYSGKDYSLMATLNPFHHQGFTGTVNLASGDINGDNFDDILVAQGEGGTGLVEAFNGLTLYNLITSGEIINLSGIGVAHETAMFSEAFQPYGDSYTGEIEITSGYVLQTPEIPNGNPIQTNAANITTLAVGDVPEGQEKIKIHTYMGSGHEHSTDDDEQMDMANTEVRLDKEFTPESNITEISGTFADVNGDRGQGVLYAKDDQGGTQLIHLQEENVPEYITVSEPTPPEPEVPKIVFGTPGGDEFDSAFPDDKQFVGDEQILFTGGGDDYVDVSEVGRRNRIDTGSGDDIVFAGNRNRIILGAGDDILFAGNGRGANRISLGTGSDQLWLTTDDNAIPRNPNRVSDFNPDEDVIGFMNTNLSLGSKGDLWNYEQMGDDVIISVLFREDMKEIAQLLNTTITDANFVFA